MWCCSSTLDFTFVCPRKSQRSPIATTPSSPEHRSAGFPLIVVQPPGRIQTERKQGGLGDIAYPLVADLKKEIAAAYNVLDEAEGVALRGLHHRPEGVVQHATVNNLPVVATWRKPRRASGFPTRRGQPRGGLPRQPTPGERTMPDPVGKTSSRQLIRDRVPAGRSNEPSCPAGGLCWLTMANGLARLEYQDHQTIFKTSSR